MPVAVCGGAVIAEIPISLDQLESAIIFRSDASFELLPEADRDSVLRAIELRGDDFGILDSDLLPASGRRYYWSQLSESCGDPVNQVLTAWSGKTIYGTCVVLTSDTEI